MTESFPAVIHRPLTPHPALDREGDAKSARVPTRHVGIKLAGFGSLRTPASEDRNERGPGGWYEPVKRSTELAIAVVLLVLTAPFVLLGVMLIKLTSRGPAFYVQMRVGRYGRPFPIIKLRTMTHNCEASSGAVWSTAGDPRITRVGRLLRRTHIDELPQLWNVLRGHMSLIGPRPERPEFIPVLEQAIAGYRDRLRARPGVTGLAQVQLPADTDLASVQRKLAYDLCYIERIGPWLDLRILLATVTKVIGVPFPIAQRLFGFPQWEEILHAKASTPPKTSIIPANTPR